MNKKDFFIIFLAVFVIMQIGNAFAIAPVVSAFEVKSVPPNQTQVSWAVSDDDGLSKIELYEDSIMIYSRNLMGVSQVDLYQVGDDGLKHTYTLIAYDIFNL